MKKTLAFTTIILAVVVLTSCATATPTPTAVPRNALEGTSVSYGEITVADLKAVLQGRDFPLINVHIPYEGEIPGTDLFIPYDQVEPNLSLLPQDKNARIVVYCMSGRMGQIAAQALSSLGYTDVVNLRGGMLAWVEQGYSLVESSR